MSTQVTRVLLSAWKDRPWAMGHYLEQALKDLGLEVAVFDFRHASDRHQDLLQAAADFRPGLHILFKGEGVAPATIEALRARGLPCVLWHHDTNYERPAWLVELVRVHDHYFTHALGMVARLAEIGLTQVSWLSEGFAPQFFRAGIITEEERRRYDADVMLVGNLHEHRLYWPRQELVRRCVRAGFKTRWWGPRIPRKLRFLPLLLGPVRRAWGGGMVYNETWARAVASSRVFLARDVQPEIEASISNRCYWALGCGAFYLCQHPAGIERLFEVGQELETFRDGDELVEKLRRFLADDAARTRIAAAGRRRVWGQYSFAHRFREMFEILRARGICDVAAGPVPDYEALLR